MQSVQTLTWQPYNVDRQSFVAVVPCDMSIDSSWQINLAGNIEGQPHNVKPRYLLIDNLPNEGQIIISFGNSWALTIPQFARETFEIPPNITQITIVGFLGTVGVMVSTEVLGPDALNQLLAVQASGLALLLPMGIVLGNAVQSGALGGRGFLFSGPQAGCNYTLIPANQVPNGFIQWIENYAEFVDGANAGKVNIVIPVGNTINGIYNSGDTFFLQQGDYGYLISDGVSDWRFIGKVSAMAIAGAGLPAGAIGTNTAWQFKDGRFSDVYSWYRCFTANNNYAVGNDVLWWMALQDTDARRSMTATDQASFANQLASKFSPGVGVNFAPLLANAATGVQFSSDPAQWRFSIGWELEY